VRELEMIGRGNPVGACSRTPLLRARGRSAMIAYNEQVMPPEDAGWQEVPEPWPTFEDFLADQTDREDELGTWARNVTEDVKNGCWPHMRQWIKHLIAFHNAQFRVTSSLERLHAEFLAITGPAADRRFFRERAKRGWKPRI
jgi:hypothetical protein